MHQIGAADNADHPPGPDDGKPLDVPAFHHFNDVFQRVVFADGPGIGRHDLHDFPARRVHVFLGQFARAEDEFEPFRALSLGADFAAPQKISFRHDADQLAFCIDHRQSADPVLQHQARSLDDRLIGADGNDVPRHDIFDLHGPLQSMNCVANRKCNLNRSCG